MPESDNEGVEIVSSARKYGKWWSQCFLTGIERILLGFRDDFGIVRHIQPLLIKDIETRAVSDSIKSLLSSTIILHSFQRTWSSSSFLAFLNEFCTFVRQTVTKEYFEDGQWVSYRCSFSRRFSIDSIRMVYLFYFSPQEKKIKWRSSTETTYQFLPHWFTSQEFPSGTVSWTPETTFLLLWFCYCFVRHASLHFSLYLKSF